MWMVFVQYVCRLRPTIYISKIVRNNLQNNVKKQEFSSINSLIGLKSHKNLKSVQIHTISVMSQKSITSFFTKTPKKASKIEAAETPRVEATKEEICSNGQSNESLAKQSKVRLTRRRRTTSADSEGSPERATAVKACKRERINSSSESDESPIKSASKKKIKRQCIQSSDSESASSPVKKTKSVSPEPEVKNISSTKSSKLSESELSPDKKTKNEIIKNGAKNLPQIEKSVRKSIKKEIPSPQSVANENKINKEKEVDSIVSKEPTTEEKYSKLNGGTNDLDKCVSELEYNPVKSGYHPIKDACWQKDQKVPYLALAKTLEAIEGTSARLKMIEILSNYFRSVIVLTPDDLLPSIYMCLNQLAPAYENLELGIAETYLMKAIGQSTGKTLAQVKAAAAKVGDLGLVAEQSRSTQRMMFQPAPLAVRNVFSSLKEIASMTGQASVNKKIAKIQTLFVACRHSEARYFIRSLAGKLRIGLAEQSVLQALALATTMTPPCQNWPPEILSASKGLSAEEFKAKVEEQALVIKTTYCECPNYGSIVPVMLKYGVGALRKHCKLTPGVPLKPMLAHPTKGVHEVLQRFENLRFTCEWKYDGERAQIHIPSKEDGSIDLKKASIFSRNQENNTSKYPDLIGRLGNLVKDSVASCVLDCEAVAWDVERKQILPFQILSTRKRKDASIQDIKVQVCVFMFDLLYLNGKALVSEPFAERRRLLKDHFNEKEGEWLYATSKDCTTMEEVQEFLEESVKGSCEGLMVKTLEGKDATYEIAKRSRNWLKLKKDYLEGVGDTLDVVVIGGYLGRGKRTGVYGGFLLACYDADAEEYQSLCKIGTGFTEEDLQAHSDTLNQKKIDGPRNYYRFDSSHSPDVWFEPAVVWEVKCADLSLSPSHRAAMGLVDPDKGISLRFPRFVRVREDKTAEEATSSRQVADIYMNQDQVKNQGSGASKINEDDFY